MNRAEATEERNHEIALDNNKIIQKLLQDVPHDKKPHQVEMRVKWNGVHLVILNQGLKVDGEDIGDTN